jgi:hypothetical protein
MVFLAAFVLALVAGLFIQQVLLTEILPQLHAGHGLLRGGDWIGFHEDGARLADRIARQGWSAFELRPGGNFPVALSAIVYYLTGVHEPWILVPVNAAIFALGAVGLFNIFVQLTDRRIAVVALIPYLLFPSSVQLYSQIHKDVWSVAGFVWLAFVCAFFAEKHSISARQYLSLFAISVFSTLAVWLVRPYLSGVYLGALLCGAAFLGVWSFLATKKKNANEWISRCAGFALCLAAVAIFAFGVPTKVVPSLAENNASNLFHTVRDAPPRPECEGRPNNIDLMMSAAVKRVLNSIINVRVGQRAAGLNAGSAIDHDVCFSQPSEVLLYIPRALQVGLFAPFPEVWFASGVSPGAGAMRIVAGGEMLLSYVLLPGIVLLLLLGGAQQRKRLLLSLSVTLPLICLLATAVPNVGTLYRMRYGYLAFLLGLGVIGWAYMLRTFIAYRRT